MPILRSKADAYSSIGNLTFTLKGYACGLEGERQ